MFKKSMGALILAFMVAGFTVSANAAPFQQETQTTMQSETMMSSNKSNKTNVKKTSVKRKKTKKRSVKRLGAKMRKS